MYGSPFLPCVWFSILLGCSSNERTLDMRLGVLPADQKALDVILSSNDVELSQEQTDAILSMCNETRGLTPTKYLTERDLGLQLGTHWSMRLRAVADENVSYDDLYVIYMEFLSRCYPTFGNSSSRARR
jgi:hypothetical protein